MSSWNEILKECLPTKWSRLTAGLTISSGTGAFFLPEMLKRVYIPISDHTTLIIRIAGPLLLWLLGTLLVLLMVVRYCKILKAQKQPISQPSFFPLKSKKVQLQKEHTNILLLLFKNKVSHLTFQIAQTLNLSEDITKYHLQELHKNKFIRKDLSILRGQDSWSIDDKGTKYLIENKLIS